MSAADPQSIKFPQSAMTGTLAQLAYVLTDGTEMQESYAFATATTFVGSMLSCHTRIGIGRAPEPRLYTINIGESASDKKSSTMETTLRYMTDWVNDNPRLAHLNTPAPCHGVGSAEGLATRFKDNAHVLLVADEFKQITDKAGIKGSSLLSVLTSIYEKSQYENQTKMESTKIDDAHLSLVACCTAETYRDLFTDEALNIGFTNRVFLVGGEKKRKVALPKYPDEKLLNALKEQFTFQLSNIPPLLSLTARAQERWTDWYMALDDENPNSKRLDLIGFKLMPTLALMNGKREIDVELTDSICSILDYELWLRGVCAPDGATNDVAKIEANIRRVLGNKGALVDRKLRQFTNAHRYGISRYEQALRNLRSTGDVELNESKQFVLGQSLRSQVLTTG